MRHYELMVILDPELEERTVTPSLETYLTVSYTHLTLPTILRV